MKKRRTKKVSEDAATRVHSVKPTMFFPASFALSRELMCHRVMQM